MSGTTGGTDGRRPRPETINRHVHNVYPGIAMLAGMQLDLFTPLAEGPMTVAGLASRLGVDPGHLEPLLYALVVAELLELEQEGTGAEGAREGARFRNAPEADAYLVRGRRGYLGSNHEVYADMWSAGLRTAETIRTGTPQARHDFGAMGRAELEAFFRGLDAAARASGRKLAREFDLSAHRRLVDVGGGSGGLAMALAERYPGLRAWVADLPSVTPITEQFIRDAGMEGRVGVLPVDLVREAPSERFDLAVLRAFVQVLSPADAAAALANVGRALEPGGRIYIMGRMLDDSRLSPPESVVFNLVFINLYDAGRAYTESEHRAWLEAAGFEDVVRLPIGEGYSIMHATRSA